MTIHRFDAKRDLNELEMVNALRKAGCRVFRLSGAGIPDLAVRLPNRKTWVLADVKSSKGTLTPAQADWGEDIRIWRTLDDALRDLGLA